jgi:LPS O-antigen subunit length determinant protein (WzzB/FepE family)
MTEPLMHDKSNSITNSQSSPQDEINLIDVLRVLVRHKFLIFLNIFLFTLAFIIYVQTTTPIYQTEVAFLEPSETFIPKSFLGKEVNYHSVLINSGIISIKDVIDSKTPTEKTDVLRKALNKNPRLNIFYNEDKKSLYFKFLTRLQSYTHQHKVFEEGDFIKKFSGKEGNSAIPEDYFLSIHKSISLEEEPYVKEKNKIKKFEKSLFLSMSGTKPAAISEFLNAISLKAIEDIKNETFQLVQSKIKDALQENDQKIKTLDISTQLEKKEIQSRIEQEYMERLRILSDSLILSKNLKIKNNNFNLPIEKMKSGEQKIPIWFLYGELALKKEIEILKSKFNDKDYIANKANLEHKHQQLDNWKILNSSNNLKTIFLKNIEQLSKLKAEKAKLESLDLSLVKPKVAIISQPAITPSNPIKPNKLKMVLIGIMLGLFAGLIATFFKHSMNAIKKQNISSP